MGELDARRGLGADQRPADPARGRLSRPISGASVHIFDVGFDAHAEAARAANPACPLRLDLGASWEALQDRCAPSTIRPTSTATTPLWFFYTSGTTGRPKAGVLTHGQMAFVITNHLCDLMPGTTEDDVSLVVAPLSHGAGVHASPKWHGAPPPSCSKATASTRPKLGASSSATASPTCSPSPPS